MKKNVQMNCPHCGKKIDVSALVVSQFGDLLKKEMEAELVKREKMLNDKLEKYRTDIREQTQKESFLKLKEKEKLITDLKDQLTKVRQKLENSSQQAVGEIQELELEEILRTTFPTDLVSPVAKGIKGADCSLIIQTKSGHQIGSILFESKRVKSFSEGWITKLKKDNLQAKCDLVVIVTSTMPSDIQGKFGLKEGVWICLFDPEAIKQLVLVLRYGLLKVFEMTNFSASGDIKAEKLFQYLTSTEFKNLFENILKGYQTLDESFKEEKIRLTKLWKIRELQLQEMLENTMQFYGEIKGISSSIPEIELPQFKRAS